MQNTVEEAPPGRRGRTAMCKGVGFDLCEVGRMEKLSEDERFLNRFFTEEEREYLRSKGKNRAQTLAGMFAAKEAFSKAMGTGIVFELQEIAVSHDEKGMPFYSLSGKAAEAAGKDRFFLSVSHDGGMAGAVCVRESGE